MASAQDIQNLLRFLSQDAKVPLAQAMGKIKELQAANLITPDQIAKSGMGAIKNVFEDDKITKQILNAAKRVSKKRGSTDAGAPAPSPKKIKSSYGQPLSPAQFEESLVLPDLCLDEEELSNAAVFTNRAPLVLAFAVIVLKYTMPEQPLSSRLSLAQAVVSANSRTKAVNLGLESGKSAEEEGWGEGQPLVKVMGREIRVMKRWGYDWEAKEEEGATQETIKDEPNDIDNKEPALWGVDLEALKKSNGPVTVGSRNVSTSQLPIYTAQSARTYLLKAFETPKSEGGSQKSPTKKKPASIVAEKERNLGLLLGALDLLFKSWSSVLSKDDLDKRAWSWYTRVRPEVASGVEGWGGKGNVKLRDILDLRRPTT
ncbi:hypothetical protein BDV96DRAFT_499026 [Lophiotrema nucula]|uniref:Impact N-terminal domain-containing protein n=1 Tax=Lophiotrema nucula TaxID=690887 RepID=A0A6A5YYX4_9PLEO|nr:hypothetical protein BDV96DRAFT_499026 [Lophiotrema nucula]